MRRLIAEARSLMESWVQTSITPSWSGWKGLTYPGMGKGGPPPEPPVSMPFRTRSAELVFQKASNLIVEFPAAPPIAIIRKAIYDAQVPAEDLTPEDIRLLEMAIELLQNGYPQSSVRTGGSPGGPARSTGPNTFRPQTR